MYKPAERLEANRSITSVTFFDVGETKDPTGFVFQHIHWQAYYVPDSGETTFLKERVPPEADPNTKIVDHYGKGCGETFDETLIPTNGPTVYDPEHP